MIAALPREGRWEIHPSQIEAFLLSRAPEIRVEAPIETPPLTVLPTVLAEATASAETSLAVQNPNLLQDVVFPYRGYHGSPSQCRIRLYEHASGDGRVVVIATELPSNPGTSITNRAEHLAGEVCRRYSLDPARLLWIEHYPDRRVLGRKLRDPLLEEHFDVVSFHREGAVFSKPKWTRLRREQVERLIGQALPAETPPTA
jgi:hypothetical protein